MPDLTVEHFYHCESAENFETAVEGSNGAKYTVRFDQYSHKQQSPVDHDWSCTCAAYKYRPGHCKHIEAVMASGARCGWMQFIDGGTVDTKDGEPCCPDCGGPVKVLGWGV